MNFTFLIPCVQAFQVANGLPIGLVTAHSSAPPTGKTPDHSFVVPTIEFGSDHDFPEVKQHDHFAVRCKGYLKIHTAGTYELYTASDDGSLLYVDGEPWLFDGRCASEYFDQWNHV